LEDFEMQVLWLNFKVGLLNHHVAKGTDEKKERLYEDLYPGGDSEEDTSNISEDLPFEIR
jgi:hypothetical protein